jgi:hypothetical protein
MAASTQPGSPLEIRLADGNRMTVALDPGGEYATDAGTELAAAVVLAGEEEADVEAAVVGVVESLGLTVSTSTSRGTKVMLVR